ncbi:DUF4391 domain-containing protein [Sphingomonas sp. Root241]|uniref:DUF4391 domain-containing protein n=1 Tax=Sphingomonas sp. Root241 TaxID=1736501 RepID=UPI0006F882B4|nr:DUF4391 domain-containing protein [Sphingomonas sp. Root241]KRC81288.1 hypothetical protein ASE13_02470 [Sphingomonas sp. Root241]
MSGSPITLETLIGAFALPPGPAPRRVPKASLADNVPTAADKRLIDGKLARLDWLAAINPATAGIAAAGVDGLEVSTINVLVARTRGPMPPRLAEIIHRAIPQPVVLIHADDAPEAPAAVSLGSKRAAEREVGRVVVTALHDTGALTVDDRGFLTALALDRLPSSDLGALYAGLIERIEALCAARRAARPFRLAASSDELARWRMALADAADLDARTAALAAAMRKESRLAARVELGETLRQTKAELDKCKTMLD